MPSPDIGSVEIAFNSIDEICHGLSVPGTADILNISKRERGISKNDFAHDAAVKVAGVYVCDDQNEASPCGIIVCQGIYNRRLSEHVNVLWRQSRQFDMRSMQYMDDLRRVTMTVGSLLEKVYIKKIQAAGSTDKRSVMLEELCQGLGKICLRWRPIQLPSARIWSRSLLKNDCVSGVLEIEIPHLIVRGIGLVKEVNHFLSRDILWGEVRDKRVEHPRQTDDA